jgi:site-specific DNA-methyltransferase (adenine-specific)
MITMLNCDCLQYMQTLPDKAFDLAIVDPPYGDANSGDFDKERGRFGGRFDRYEIKNTPVARTGGTWSQKYQIESGLEKDIRHWDVAPPPEYFEQLFRVAKNVIIWGGNYFALPPQRNFIIWKKLTISESFSMAMAEYAWTNITGNAKFFECVPQGNAKTKRFHPTQKPVALYKWLLQHYAKPGDKILDTHGGSGSICIACHDLGYDLTWMELDADYYAKACQRYKNHSAQATLF